MDQCGNKGWGKGRVVTKSLGLELFLSGRRSRSRHTLNSELEALNPNLDFGNLSALHFTIVTPVWNYVSPP